MFIQIHAYHTKRILFFNLFFNEKIFKSKVALYINKLQNTNSDAYLHITIRT